MPDELHDPVNFISQLRQILSADKLPLAFFLGAGCPMGVLVPDGEGTRPIIPDIRGLTEKVRNEALASPTEKASFEILSTTFREDGFVDPTVEDMLNRVRAFRDVAGNVGVRGLSASKLTDLDKLICGTIRDAVRKPLPSESTPYHALADFVRAGRKPVTEIFTTNYDLLMEEALEARRAPFFDGFVGSVRPFFDQRAIEDNETSYRWTRLWKIHGSINWRIDLATKSIFRSSDHTDGAELLIHPSRLKYDESRRMPYLIMIDRLRSFLRQGRPAALIVCGYSFGDEHINAAIVEGLQNNPSAVCFALQYGKLKQYDAATVLARKIPNLAVFAKDGAVFRGQSGPWAAHPSVEQGMLAGLFEPFDPDEPKPSEGEKGTTSLVLGNFARLGDFLQHFVSLGQLGREGNE